MERQGRPLDQLLVFALDTDTVSNYFRGDPQVVPRLQSLAPSQIGIPAIVSYELRDAVMRIPVSAEKTRPQALDQFLASVYVMVFNDQASDGKLAHGFPGGLSRTTKSR